MAQIYGLLYIGVVVVVVSTFLIIWQLRERRKGQ